MKINEQEKPIEESKFLKDLSEQTAFPFLTLDVSYESFKKKYSNELYAQKCFDTIVNVAMVEDTSLEYGLRKFFVENDVEKIRQSPFRIKGKLTEQDEDGFWKADIFLIVYDIENPGIEVCDTLGMNTKKHIKKEALDELQNMAKTVMDGFLKDKGIEGNTVNMITGKSL